MDQVLILGLATAASSLVTAVVVALITSWVARSGSRDTTAIAMIDSLSEQLKVSDVKHRDCATQLAEVRRTNWDLLERMETLEHNDREKSREIADLGTALVTRDSKIGVLEGTVRYLQSQLPADPRRP